jgi:hypothetical protein
MRNTFIVDPSPSLRAKPRQEWPRSSFIEKPFVEIFLSPTHNAELSRGESRQL